MDHLNTEQDLRFPLMEYFNFIKGNENSRTVYEGEEVLNAGHVILCDILGCTNDEINLYGLCLQSSALQSSPHIIQGVFKTINYQCSVKQMVCSCKAGKGGRCKHISAILLKCTRTAINKLEIISQTDIQCTWSTQKADTKEKYKPVPLKEMSCISTAYKNRTEVNIDADKQNEIAALFINDLPNSALALHNKGRKNDNSSIKITSDTPVVESSIDNTIILNNASESVLMMELNSIQISFICSNCEQFYNKYLDLDVDSILCRTKESKFQWNQERQYRITGSRIYEIYTYKLDNWPLKCSKYFFPKSFTNKFTSHGIKHEPNARKIFIEKTGFNVREFGLVVSFSNPWLGFSPDGIIFDQNNKPFGLLEIKCPFAGATGSLETIITEIPYLLFKDNAYILKKNHKHFAQVEMGMALLNLTSCFLVIYCSHDQSMLIIDVPFDYNYSKTILFQTKEKYFKNMLHSICSTK